MWSYDGATADAPRITRGEVGTPTIEDGNVADRTPDAERETGPSALVDADRFLALTERLRRVRERIETGRTAERRLRQWQRILVAISDAAKDDLDGAERKLTRLEAELDRHLDGA